MEDHKTEADIKGEKLEDLYDKMSAFVSKHGPLLLTRGMSAIEANESIMACLEFQQALIDKLQNNKFGGEEARRC